MGLALCQASAPTLLRWLVGLWKMFTPLEYAIDWAPEYHALIPVRGRDFFLFSKGFRSAISVLLNGSWGFPEGYSSQGMK
jgi:hypothetical protein